jgi:pimeloyl-ACP methyl ester carboxylesterase
MAREEPSSGPGQLWLNISRNLLLVFWPDIAWAAGIEVPPSPTARLLGVGEDLLMREDRPARCWHHWENKADFFDAKPITIPFAISVFPDELYQAPRSWAERAYPHNLIYYNRLDRGGHFAAWEQPDLFAAEMRAAFRALRK